MTTQHELLDAAIKRVGNRYLATMLVAKRIRQLHHGAPPYVNREDGDSHFTVAMREIAEGRVVMEPSATGEADALITAAAASAQEMPITVTQTTAVPAETPDAATTDAASSNDAVPEPSAEGSVET